MRNLIFACIVVAAAVCLLPGSTRADVAFNRAMGIHADALNDGVLRLHAAAGTGLFAGTIAADSSHADIAWQATTAPQFAFVPLSGQDAGSFMLNYPAIAVRVGTDDTAAVTAAVLCRSTVGVTAVQFTSADVTLTGAEGLAGNAGTRLANAIQADAGHLLAGLLFPVPPPIGNSVYDGHTVVAGGTHLVLCSTVHGITQRTSQPGTQWPSQKIFVLLDQPALSDHLAQALSGRPIVLNNLFSTGGNDYSAQNRVVMYAYPIVNGGANVPGSAITVHLTGTLESSVHLFSLPTITMCRYGIMAQPNPLMVPVRLVALNNQSVVGMPQPDQQCSISLVPTGTVPRIFLSISPYAFNSIIAQSVMPQLYQRLAASCLPADNIMPITLSAGSTHLTIMPARLETATGAPLYLFGSAETTCQ